MNTQLDFSDMSGAEFENLILQLVRKMGFEAQQTKASGDGGIDIVAHYSQPFLEGTYIIQCKRWSSSIGEPVLRDLYGVVMSERANKGILVTTSYFTSSATSFADGKPIELIDGDKLSSLLDRFELALNKSSSQNSYGYSYDLESYIKDHDKIAILKEELSVRPNNTNANYLVACIIMDRIMNDNRYNYDMSMQEMNFLIEECRKHLIILEKNRSSNKQDIGKSYIAHIFNAQLYLIQGNFFEALNHYQFVLQWDYLMQGDNELQAENLFVIINNIIQIYCLLGLKSKAMALCKKYDRVFKAILDNEELIHYGLGYSESETFFIRDMNGEVDFVKTTWRYVEKVKACEICFFVFWDCRLYYTGGHTEIDKEVYRELRNSKHGVYFLMWGSRYEFNYDEAQNPIGLKGFPIWNSEITGNIEEVSKRIEVLF